MNHIVTSQKATSHQCSLTTTLKESFYAQGFSSLQEAQED
jgi:hypothetical protein